MVTMWGLRPFQISGGLVAIGRLDPEDEAEAGRVGTRILERDLEAGGLGDESLERGRRVRHLGLVVDEGEIAEVDGHEVRIGPGRRERRGRRKVRPCGAKSPVASASCEQRGVEAEDDVGLGRRAFELHAAEGADGAVGGDEVDRAAAGLLEAGLEQRAGAIVGGECVVGVDGERGLILRRTRARSARGEPQAPEWRNGTCRFLHRLRPCD